MNNDVKLIGLLKDTVYCFVSPEAEVTEVVSIPGTGRFAYAHKVKLRMAAETEGPDGQPDREITLLSKQATFIERSALSRLYSQAANVPYSLSNCPLSKERSLLVVQDVAHGADPALLDPTKVKEKRLQALAYIHVANLGCLQDLPWLPKADLTYIAGTVEQGWREAWEAAHREPDFAGRMTRYGEETLARVEDAAEGIAAEMAACLAAVDTYTMIHHSLNPEGVLTDDQGEVYFADWEDARYGSLFLDLPLHCSGLKDALAYRNYLSVFGFEIPEERFIALYGAATRYAGLRLLGEHLGRGRQDAYTEANVFRALQMVLRPVPAWNGLLMQSEVV
ncbi:phosphotransferase [Paenibacillus sp. NFR01]|uniref:phosphotransferase n=1 Tax=Paenibacillus sp. NFR01 TaxID=1566279 RepID=UPI0008BB8DF5|nr:phosphotransferase [Paenibacillus sp. NFR01]SEU01846.1 hypothetical protein SAMN03159358_3115 [Paenibacillus sp. NFR01]